MKPKFFLEDIGKIVTSTGGKNIWKIKDLSSNILFKDMALPSTIYVVDFPGRGIGQEFLLGRHISGPRKFLLIKQIGHEMIRMFKNQFIGRVAQFVILWGGRPLDLLAADPPLFTSNLIDTTYLKLTRVEDKSAARGWKVVESAIVGQWWKNDTWIIMEECIASGKTLEFFVEEAFKNHIPKKLFLFPVAASSDGLEGINKVCAKNNVEFIPVLNSAVIEVAKEGISKPYTDLGLREKTIVTKEFCRDLRSRYQDKPICWVGDIGDSLYKTHKYLIETLSDMNKIGLDLSKEDFSFWDPEIRSKEFLEKLKKQKPEVYKIAYNSV